MELVRTTARGCAPGARVGVSLRPGPASARSLPTRGPRVSGACRPPSSDLSLAAEGGAEGTAGARTVPVREGGPCPQGMVEGSKRRTCTLFRSMYSHCAFVRAPPERGRGPCGAWRGGSYLPQALAMLYSIGTPSAHPRPPALRARADPPHDYKSVCAAHASAFVIHPSSGAPRPGNLQRRRQIT